MEIVAALVGVGTVMVLIAWIWTVDRKGAVSRLRGFADERGLQLLGAGNLITSLSLVGTDSGRPLRFWMFSGDHSKSGGSWAAVGVKAKTLDGFTFELRPRNPLTKIATMFGAREAVTGESVFDRRWSLQTIMPEALAAALIPQVRDQLDAAYERGLRGSFLTDRDWVCYTEPGTLSSSATLERLESVIPLLRDLTDVAEVCAGTSRA